MLNPAAIKPFTVGGLLLLLTATAVPTVVVAAMPSGADGPANDQKREKLQGESWRIALNLQASERLPSAVQWAICDKDPVPGFKSRIRQFQGIYREELKEAENETAKEEKRQGQLAVQWDWGFKEIPGDRLYLLTADNPGPLTTNAPDGKKWIVTKVRKAKGKPVCWSIPVEVKYGKEIKVTLTDKNVLDLEAAAQSALREPAASPQENRIEEWRRKTWRIQLALRVPGSEPFEVTYAIFNEDPVSGFKASVKKSQANRKGDPPENAALSGDERRMAIAANWDGVFKRIPGSRLYQLRSTGSQTYASNEPDGKKWIVTKFLQIKGKAVCWSLPVEVKTGEAVKVTLTESNVLDPGSVFDGALRESESKK